MRALLNLWRRAEPAFVAETLKWCNEHRARRGLEPLKRLPKGKRGDSNSCPCGSATGLVVGPTLCWELLQPTGCRRFPLPTPVRLFVEHFDDGRLPQYDAERG